MEIENPGIAIDLQNNRSKFLFFIIPCKLANYFALIGDIVDLIHNILYLLVDTIMQTGIVVVSS